MERGKIIWVDKISIIRDKVSRRPKVTVEGLWTGKDRRMIGRMLLQEMRREAHKIIQIHKKADLIEQKRLEGLAKAREAKRIKKLLEEEKEDVRGQRNSETKQ